MTYALQLCKHQVPRGALAPVSSSQCTCKYEKCNITSKSAQPHQEISNTTEYAITHVNMTQKVQQHIKIYYQIKTALTRPKCKVHRCITNFTKYEKFLITLRHNKIWLGTNQYIEYWEYCCSCCSSCCSSSVPFFPCGQNT